MSEDLFEILSWEQIYTMLLDLADKIRKDNLELEIIVGVSRGGWAPSRVMSDLLENPQVTNVRAEFYRGLPKRMSKMANRLRRLRRTS